jgi:tetratricopeptide (TPR) repeat protein
MGQILKFPGPASKFGYKRVKRRASEDPNQLHLFSQPTAQILPFAPDLTRFAQALFFDERGDARAAELYLKAIEEQDCVADAYCNLGILQSKQGNTAKAFDCFTASLKQDPRHLEAHYNLGNLYFEANDCRLAQLHYELAVAVDPSFPSAYFNLALVQAINEELGAAVSSLTRYQELVGKEEGHNAEELLDNLKKSLAALAKNSRLNLK